MKISANDGLARLAESKKLFVELFSHGTLSIEVYKPEKIDKQTPHDRDEVYIIISGQGNFFSDGVQYDFKPGDFFFVPAGIEHRFQNFSDDFST